jgi:hypothetical protein
VPDGHRPLLAPEAYFNTVTKRRAAQAASRIASSRFNHSPIWFQLAKMRLTTKLANLFNHLRGRNRPTAERNRIAAARVLD